MLIFLDIDGVLNSKAWMESPNRPLHGGESWVEMFDPEAVERLNEITKQTGADVVISSSWRLIEPLEELREILSFNGVKAKIISCTPSMRGCRGDEISSWIAVNCPGRDYVSFVILDDDSDMGIYCDDERFIQTDWETGLLDYHVRNAIRILRCELDEGN